MPCAAGEKDHDVARRRVVRVEDVRHLLAVGLPRRRDQLFRKRREGERDRKQAGERCYSITLSARNSIVCEIGKPSALAVTRFMYRYVRVGCSIGSSPGLAPFRTRST